MILPVRFLLYKGEDGEKYNIIKKSDDLKLHHPGKRAVHIKRTIYAFDFDGIETVEECVFLGCTIHSMDIIKPSELDIELIFRKCIFYGCTIDSMRVQGINDISRIYFINCKIQNLELNDIYATEIYFIDCDIKNSTFKYSTLPGLTFSKFDQEQFEDIIEGVITINGEKAQEVKNEILEYSREHKHKRESKIYRSEFLFCKLNGVYIKETKIAGTSFRHCHLQDLIISRNVVMRGVDLRGAKVLDTYLGPNKFQNTRFNKGFFMIDIIVFFWIKMLKFYEYKRISGQQIFFRTPPENEYIEIAAWKKVSTVKRSIKKLLYKNRISRFLVNVLSSTEIKNTFYDEADFSNDFQFFWYIKHLESVDNFKKSQPKIAFFSFITTNYMRSIGGLVWWSIIGILIFSLFLSSCGRFDVYPEKTGKDCPISTPVDDQGHPKEPIYLSFAIFMNNDLYPLVARDNFTKIIIVLEVSFGYIVLGVFVGILASMVSQRSSIPPKRKRKTAVDKDT